MWAVMADYGIPAGDKLATIVGIHSRRCVGKTTGMQTHPASGCAINVTLCWSGNIWRGEKCSVGVELGQITPYD